MKRRRKQVFDDRPGLREQLGIAVNARSLGDDPERVTAADRLGALATADNLGSLLVHIRYGNQIRYIPEAVELWMALRLAERKRRNKGARWGAADLCLHQMALEEWVRVVCQTCFGTGVLGSIFGRIDPVRITCGVCGNEGSVTRRSKRVDDLALAGAMVGNEVPDLSVRAPCRTCRGMPIFKAEINRTVHQCHGCSGTGRFSIDPAQRIARLQREEDAAAERYGREAKQFTLADWETTLQPVYDALLDDLKRYDKAAIGNTQVSMRRWVGAEEREEMASLTEDYRLAQWLEKNTDVEIY